VRRRIIFPIAVGVGALLIPPLGSNWLIAGVLYLGWISLVLLVLHHGVHWSWESILGPTFHHRERH
jgi:hypothetical protein